MLVFGKNGQVAQELARLQPQAQFLTRDEIDLGDPHACAEIISRTAPPAVINAAAYTAVDRAESEPEVAARVNGEAPGEMARACARLDIPFIQISTDYVFSGEGELPHGVSEEIKPINAYGRSKALGEDRVREAGGRFAILRTSWVFSEFGTNFVKTMLALPCKRNTASIIGDQVGGPTPARAVAEVCITLAKVLQEDPLQAGIYHLSGTPDVSWADFAREIFLAAGRSVKVSEVLTSDFPSVARRPLNSRLDCTSLSRIGLSRPEWRQHLYPIITRMEQS